MFCSLAIDTSRLDGESRIDIGLICLLGPMGDSIHMPEVGAIRGSQYPSASADGFKRQVEFSPICLGRWY